MGLVTPVEVEQAEFSTALLGYNPDQVDDLLDMISITMRRFLKTNRELSRKNYELEARIRELTTDRPDNDRTVAEYLKEETWAR